MSTSWLALGEDRRQKIRDDARDRRDSRNFRRLEKSGVDSPVDLTSTSSDDVRDSCDDFEKEPPRKKQKIDLMSSTANTADRLG